jgi:hypothetical protein
VRIEPFAKGRGPVPMETAENLAKDWHVRLDELVQS